MVLEKVYKILYSQKLVCLDDIDKNGPLYAVQEKLYSKMLKKLTKSLENKDK